MKPDSPGGWLRELPESNRDSLTRALFQEHFQYASLGGVGEGLGGFGEGEAGGDEVLDGD